MGLQEALWNHEEANQFFTRLSGGNSYFLFEPTKVIQPNRAKIALQVKEHIRYISFQELELLKNDIAFVQD